jgi:glycosyltransferase involved in cell wall biosynthesis
MGSRLGRRRIGSDVHRSVIVGLSGRDIVCLSTHYWDERRFRKQEFMERFALRNRILFVEPSFPMVRQPEAHLREVATNHLLSSRLEQRDPNLHLLKPSRRLPRSSRPSIERLTYAWWGRQIGRAVRRLGFENAIVWLYHPAYLAGLGAIGHTQLVLDLVDDLAAYHGADGSHVERQIASLVARSDLLVTTAAPLADRYGRGARSSVVVPNGFSGDVFSPRARELPPPADLADIPRPWLGFVGTLFSFLDFELLETVARAHPDKSLVLVGPTETSTRNLVERLAALPNVYYLGSRPQIAIPAYVAHFDVCLNAFKVSRVADSVSPLKVYEYLAAGKPVISSPMKALREEPAGEAVIFAETPTEFVSAISRALAEDDEAARERRQAIASSYSWDELFARLDEACATALAG